MGRLISFYLCFLILIVSSDPSRFQDGEIKFDCITYETEDNIRFESNICF